MRWMNQLTSQTVVVHMVNGQSLRGVLTGVFRDCLVLMHARYLSTDGDVVVDGEVIVPRTNVAWMQVVNTKDS